MIIPTINIKVERWKFNSEYGVYVSTLGHFKDRQKRNLSYKIDSKKGYCKIKTEKDFIAAHRLVLLTWRPIPNRENMTVDHLNHNKRDNSLENLEWVSLEENLRRAKRDLITSSEKVESDFSQTLVKINGILMQIDEVASFILYNKGNKFSGVTETDIKRYLTRFVKNTNHSFNVTKVSRYGYTFERVQTNEEVS